LSQRTQVYNATTSGLVQSLLAGKNSMLFAYGITNSGKTHTIQGTPNEPGVLPRALRTLFECISNSETRYEVYASYYEIYNDQLFDLMEQVPDDWPKDQIYRRKVQPAENGSSKI